MNIIVKMNLQKIKILYPNKKLFYMKFIYELLLFFKFSPNLFLNFFCYFLGIA